MNSLKSHLAAAIGIFHTFGAKMIGVGEAFYKQESEGKLNRNKVLPS
jgi:hypothetical protein